jgi:hypothetical protein
LNKFFDSSRAGKSSGGSPAISIMPDQHDTRVADCLDKLPERERTVLARPDACRAWRAK